MCISFWTINGSAGDQDRFKNSYLPMKVKWSAASEIHMYFSTIKVNLSPREIYNLFLSKFTETLCDKFLKIPYISID